MQTVKSGNQNDITWASENLVIHQCPTCFITFAIPQRMHEEAKRCTRGSSLATVSFHCPNGHCLSYPGENEEERLRRQLDFERSRSGSLVARLDQSEARRAAQKGATTRARKERDRIIVKIREGVCPVKGCGRTFTNVKNHIHAKHPEFDIPDDHE